MPCFRMHHQRSLSAAGIRPASRTWNASRLCAYWQNRQLWRTRRRLSESTFRLSGASESGTRLNDGAGPLFSQLCRFSGAIANRARKPLLAVDTARAKGPLYRVFGGRADRYSSQRADKISALLFHLQFAMPHVRQANVDRSCVTIRCVNRIRLPFEV